MSAVKDSKKDDTTFDDMIFEGQEFRKKAIALAKTGKGAQGDVKKYYDTAIQKFKDITELKNLSNPEKNTVTFELAQTYVDKAHSILELGLVLQEQETETHSSLMAKALNVLSTVPPTECTPDMLYLQGKIAYERSELINDLLEQEKLLIQSCVYLINALKKQKNHESSLSLLDTAFGSLNNGKKERKKVGNAVFHICGELIQQGSNSKNWKSRFFVVDESTISYFKTKKEWDNSIKDGNNKKAYGTISFLNVLDVSFHGRMCPLITATSRPKQYKNSPCAHIHTKEKTYNFLVPDNSPERIISTTSSSSSFLSLAGSSSSPVPSSSISPSNSSTSTTPLVKSESDSATNSANEWGSTMKNVLRAYVVKKDAKGFIRKSNNSVGGAEWDDDEDNMAPSSFIKSKMIDNTSLTAITDSPKNRKEHDKEKEKEKAKAKSKTKRNVHWADKVKGKELSTFVAPIPGWLDDNSEPEQSDGESDESEDDSEDEQEDKDVEETNSSNINEEKGNTRSSSFSRSSIIMDPIYKDTKRFKDEDNKSGHYNEFQEKIRFLPEEKLSKMVNTVLKQYESEKQLRKLFKQMIMEDPLLLIKKMTDLQEFEIAKFGAYQKMNNYLQQNKD